MNPKARADLLKERFKTLYPTAVKNYSSKKPRKRRMPYLEPFKEARPMDFSLVGSRHKEQPVGWVAEANQKKRVAVETKKRRSRPLPLTVISELLQPGSPHLAMRR